MKVQTLVFAAAMAVQAVAPMDAAATTRCRGQTLVTGTIFGRAQLGDLIEKNVPVEVLQLASFAAALSLTSDDDATTEDRITALQNSKKAWDLGLIELGAKKGRAYVDDNRILFDLAFEDAREGVRFRGAGLAIGGAVIGGVIGQFDNTPGSVITGLLGAAAGNKMAKHLGINGAEWVLDQAGKRFDDAVLVPYLKSMIADPCVVTAKVARDALDKQLRDR